MKRILMVIFLLLLVAILNSFTHERPKESLRIPNLITEKATFSNIVKDIRKLETNGDCKESDEQLNSNDTDWELIWNDEFNNDCLDEDKWTIEDWAAIKNNELQYYSPNNVKVEDGVLKLISREERYKGRDYTSGAVHTKDKFELLYGKVEIRAKLPAGQGLFPAFWMMTNQEDSWLPEIDIMEMLGHKPNEIWMVVHWLDEEGKLTSDSHSFIGPDYSQEFHTFSIEWTPDSIAWFIDGVERYRTNVFVPRENMYLYLNTAIGGNWPGSPDRTTEFPAAFEIDYVRVYKFRGD